MMKTNMKYPFIFFTKWFAILTALSATLAGCVSAPPQNITIVEGVTLNQPILLPICEGLKIEVTEDKLVNITGLEQVESLCVYHDPEKKWQVKGLEMALVAFPADQKPSFIAENFMLALLGQENLLMRIQMDTNGMGVQDEALAELSKILGTPSVVQAAPKENFWGATEGATLAAWNTNFIEAMYIAEVKATQLGSISLTSKSIFQHTIENEETTKSMDAPHADAAADTQEKNIEPPAPESKESGETLPVPVPVPAPSPAPQAEAEAEAETKTETKPKTQPTKAEKPSDNTQQPAPTQVRRKVLEPHSPVEEAQTQDQVKE